MATLDDLKGVLESIDTTMKEQKTLLVNMLSAQATRDRLSSVNTDIVSPTAQSGGQSIGQAAAPGIGAGIGSAAEGAGGLIGMGAGIAGFMAALSIGSVGLDWLGSDYSGLGTAFASFSDAMENLSPAAMTALAGAAAIAAGTASFKNLYGLGTASGMTGLGAGISGFLIGLSLGEIGLSWVGNDYSAVGGALASFSEAIGNLSTEAVTVFAGVAGIAVANQAFGGDAKKLAKNMTGVAAGIAGFLGGLVLTDIGLDWITGISGADGSGLNTAFKMFSDSVGSLSTESLLVLGGLAAVATKFDADPKRTAKNMFGVSAGIAGFLGGLVLADIGLDWITGISGADGSGLNAAFKMFNDSVAGLSVESIAVLGTLLGVASKFTINPATIATSMFGLSAGIAGFLGGLVLADKGLSWLDAIPSGSGDGLVSAFKMFNDIILALSPEAMTALGVLMAAGAALGATGVGAAGIAVGLPAIGVGIAGFMSALAVGDGITQLIAMGTGGAPGEGLKSLFTNVFQGVAAAKELDGIDLVGLGAGLISVSAGLAAFGVGSIISGLGQAAAAIISFFTGESAFDQIMKIADNAEGLVKGGEALEKITSALSKFADIKISAIDLDFEKLAIDLGRAIPFLDALANGGPVPGSGNWWGGDDINFPKGLLDPSLNLDEMADAIAKVNFVLGKSNVNPNMQQSVASATAESNLTGAQGNIPMDGAIRETNAKILQEQERSARLEAEIERRTAASAAQAAANVVVTDGRIDARAATYVGGPTIINNMSYDSPELSFGSAM
jgi:hypothetical protein